jgi:hypothetical protein
MVRGIPGFALQYYFFITSQHDRYPTAYQVLGVTASIGIYGDAIIVHSKLKIGIINTRNPGKGKVFEVLIRRNAHLLPLSY